MKVIGRCFFLFFILISKNAFAQQPRLVLPVGHTGNITGANFSPNGKLIATCSNDRTIKIWDVATGKLVQTLIGHTSEVQSAFFSPDGTHLVTASWDGTVKTWDIFTGKTIKTIEDYVVFESAVYNKTGELILSASSRGIQIWNASSGELVKTVAIEKGVSRAEYDRNNKYIVSTLVDSNSIEIWDAVNFNFLKKLVLPKNKLISASVSPDGQSILTSEEENADSSWVIRSVNRIRLWNILTGVNTKTINKKYQRISLNPFSNDGKCIILNDYKVSLLVNLQTGKTVRTISMDNDVTSYGIFSPDNGLLLLFADKGAFIINAKTGVLLHQLQGHTEKTDDICVSPDGKSVLTINRSGGKVWENSTAKLLFNLPENSSWMNSADFSPDGKHIALGGFTNNVIIYNSLNGFEEKSIDIPFIGTIHLVKYDARGRFLLIAASDYKNNTNTIIWDIDGDSLQKSINGLNETAAFSNDSRYLVFGDRDSVVKILEIASSKIVKSFYGISGYINATSFSGNDKYVVACASDKTARIWEVETGRLIATLEGHDGNVNSAWFSADSKLIVTSSEDQTVKIWNAITGELIKTLTGHSSGVNKAFFFSNGEKVITISDDNTAKIWSTTNGKNLSTFFSLDSLDYFAETNENYYQCSPNAAKLLHYVTPDLKVITFEQLDVKYNRPDLVLKAIGNKDTNLINSYKKAYYKRIKKLDIDTTAFHDGYSVPESDFANRDAIEYEQKSDKLLLKIQGHDSTYKLDRFNIWVNEIPLYGQRGISIRNKKTNNIDTSIFIQLSAGENKIETSILNVNGTESYRMPLYVKYIPVKTEKQKIHFIGIGMDKFANPNYNLNYSSKDIRDLATSMKERYSENLQIDTLFNENVTTTRIAELKKKLLKTGVNDKVIVAYSGHGLLSKDFDYFLSTYNVDFEHPEINGLPYEALENLLDSIPARQKLMLIDACHSGEVDKDELLRINKMADSLGLKNGAKGTQVVSYESNENNLGLQNSFELMQELFVNVGKGTGATIISASGGTQFALENGGLKNGVFTYSILEAMKNNPTMTVSQLKTIVGKRVVELTNGMQKPTSRNETINSDWRVW